VPPGKSVVILGPSGSGRFTLLRVIAGLEIPDAVAFIIDGRVVSNPEWVLDLHLGNIASVFQSPSLWPDLTLLRIAASLWGACPAMKRI
jgi:ABC-type Fe3+/spermidine/putrescine transport system ATPase subunit